MQAKLADKVLRASRNGTADYAKRSQLATERVVLPVLLVSSL